MGGQMRGKVVERSLHLRFIGELRARAQPAKPRRALAIVAEQSVHIGAHHAPVRRNRAVASPIGKLQQRVRAARSASEVAY